MKGDNKSFYEFYRKLNINIKINLRTCKLYISKMKRNNYKFVCFNVRPAELCTKSKDLLNVSAIRTLPLQFVIPRLKMALGILISHMILTCLVYIAHLCMLWEIPCLLNVKC